MLKVLTKGQWPKNIHMTAKIIVLLIMQSGNIKTSAVILLAIISLVGLCWVQYSWLEDSIATNREIFEQKIDLAAGMVKKSLKANEPLHDKVIDDLINEGELQRMTEEKFVSFIDSIMVNEAGLNTHFNYGIYEHQHQTSENAFTLLTGDDAPAIIDFENCPVDEKNGFGWMSMVANKVTVCGGDASDMFHYHLGLFFPDSNLYLLSEMKETLGAAFLFIILIIACFSYTIITIRRQKRLSEMKNDFINNLTHEFKTPIFSIDLAAGMLKQAPELAKADKLKKYVDLIGSEGKRLKNQVDKVLQMALVDSNNFKLEKQELDLHALINKVVENFDFLVSERGGAINLNLKATKTILLADETHLKNIIYNLLDNAQKYSPDKPIIIISTNDTDEGVSLNITDNGIGMDEVSQRYIFDKFYRANTSDIHDVKGFGLGLSYVKSVIEAHQASIKLVSKPNNGSTFTLQFKA